MQNKNLSVIAYANGWTLWMYRDVSISIDDMMKEGFFDKVKDLMAVGDVFYLIAKDTVKHVWVKTMNPVSLEDLGE